MSAKKKCKVVDLAQEETNNVEESIQEVDTQIDSYLREREAIKVAEKGEVQNVKCSIKNIKKHWERVDALLKNLSEQHGFSQEQYGNLVCVALSTEMSSLEDVYISINKMLKLDDQDKEWVESAIEVIDRMEFIVKEQAKYKGNDIKEDLDMLDYLRQKQSKQLTNSV